MTCETRACRCCGKIIESVSRERTHEGCRCEDCFLDSRQRDLDGGADAEHYAFAQALAAALDLRERETGLHSKRVACHTLVLARRFTDKRETLRQIYWGALLHDIGKIGVPDAILLKQAPLTPADQTQMRLHPRSGHAILSYVPRIREAAEIVLAHEERFDGTGYPRGPRGDAIPFGAPTAEGLGH